MTISKRSEKSLPTLIHELDGHFSRWIRTRDTVNGVIRCFICGKKLSFQEAQCMHFINRDHMPTRYYEKNCHSGCEECNCIDMDHAEKYKQKLQERYGPRIDTDLSMRSRSLQKYMRHELEDLIEYYKSENRLKTK